MKKLVASQVIAVVVAVTGSSAYASNVGIDVNLHLGNHSRPVREVREVYVPPVVAYAPVDHDCGTRKPDPRFVYREDLGLYVAVGVPYEMCYSGNSYYLFRDGRWLRSYRNNRGPWVVVGYRELPEGLRRHNIERFRFIRDSWSDRSDHHRRERDHDNGRWESRRDDRWREARR